MLLTKFLELERVKKKRRREFYTSAVKTAGSDWLHPQATMPTQKHFTPLIEPSLYLRKYFFKIQFNNH